MSFPDPRWTSLAAKMRVIRFVAQDCQARAQELVSLQGEYWQRPHGTWHYKCYFTILAAACEDLRKNGISNEVVAVHLRGKSMSFQAAAEGLIVTQYQDIFRVEGRLRAKLAVWKLNGVPGQQERRVLKNFQLLKASCQPRIVACYFRTLWNGWLTFRRMRTCPTWKSANRCVLGCDAEDSIQHYALCSVFWGFAFAQSPGGLGLGLHLRSKETFFLVNPQLSDEERIRIAIGIYALHMVICHCRSQPSCDVDHVKLLKLHARRGTGSSMVKKTRYSS